MAKETLHWDRPFHTVRSGSFENGDIVWFPEGGLNASYNCVDRWAFKHPDKVRVLHAPSPHSPSPNFASPSSRHPVGMQAPSPRLRNPYSVACMRWHLPVNARFPCLRNNPGHRRVARLCLVCMLSLSPAFPAAVGSRVARMSRQARSHARQIARMRHGRAGESIFSRQGPLPQHGRSFPVIAPRIPASDLPGRVQTLTDLGVHRRRSSTRPTSPTRAPTSRTPSSCARCAPSRTSSSRGVSRRATPCPCTCP